jgi:hypothetical protein
MRRAQKERETMAGCVPCEMLGVVVCTFDTVDCIQICT